MLEMIKGGTSMNGIRNLIRLSILILLSMGCSLVSSASERTISDSKQSTSLSTQEFQSLVDTWNNAHANKNITAFTNLFGNSVLFYGTRLEKNKCIENKLSLLKKYPDFSQSVYGEIQTEFLNDSEVTCSFIKRVHFNNTTKDYPSYLKFRRVTDTWKIITESDSITDKNLAKRKNPSIPKNAIKGDFNGDGTTEFAWLVAPKIKEDGMDCEGECSSYIKFSNSTIPTIKIVNCIGGTPDNLGNLNKNKSDEIGLSPEWFTSCWSAYYVWTLRDNKWIYAVEPISTHCNQLEQGIKPIEANKKNNGTVIIRYSDLDDGGIVVKSKIVQIK